jgi:hypothetical protein
MLNEIADRRWHAFDDAIVRTTRNLVGRGAACDTMTRWRSQTRIRIVSAGQRRPPKATSSAVPVALAFASDERKYGFGERALLWNFL